MNRAINRNDKTVAKTSYRRLMLVTAITAVLILVHIALWLAIGRSWAASWAESFGLVGYSVLNVLAVGYFAISLKYPRTYLDVVALIFVALVFLLEALNILVIGHFCARAMMDFSCMVVALCAMIFLLSKIRKRMLSRSMRITLIVVSVVFIMIAFLWTYTGWFPYIGEHPVGVMAVGVAGLIWVAI